MKFKNCKFDARIGPYSSVVERQSCKLKVRSSILREGIIFIIMCFSFFFPTSVLNYIKFYYFGLFSDLNSQYHKVLPLRKNPICHLIIRL